MNEPVQSPAEPVMRTIRVCGIETTFAIDPDSDDPIGRFILASETLCEPPLQLLVDLVAPGMRVLDVGAHIGTFALTAAAAGCSVLAVEGSPSNVRLLEAAAAISPGDVEIVHAVVAAEPVLVSFTPERAWGHVTLAHDRELGHASIVVEAATIDDLVRTKKWESVDFMKIDIEGSEPAALRGASSTLAGDAAPTVLFEVNGIDLEYYSSSSRSLLAQMRALGFVLWRVDRRNERRLVPRDVPDAEYDAVSDYLAVKPEPARQPLVGWTVAPWSFGEEVAQAIAALSDGFAAYRAYAARELRRAPRRFRWNRQIRMKLKELRADQDPTVREWSAWSSRGDRVLPLFWAAQAVKRRLGLSR